MRSEATEQPELCPHELDSNGAEFDLWEFVCSEPAGNDVVTTFANLPISGFLDLLPTEKARSLLASCWVISNLLETPRRYTIARYTFV